MISLIVYGRNDQHGYNSHRRVALSLNAMAEVLTAPGDEILFVDYATPFGMPTLPEAIEDTLTDRALERMRVFRVSPEFHAAAVGERSRLPISEPHARNTAIRRAAPGNWILSTNTDMVFVPKAGRSLSELVADLEGDAYCLPRFEIPEWLWESVPRTAPGEMIRLLDEWGESIGLDEVTLGHDWILYDAPGDFQLLRRPLIEEIQAFDEEMIHGWHVDSNLWRRVHNRIGDIGTLYPDIAGYHTNHNRTLTRLMNAQPTGNDLGRFVYGVRHSDLPAQADSWGFAGEDIPEIRLTRVDPRPRLRAAAARGGGQAGPLITSDTREQMSVLGYDARHVLPFALDPVIGQWPRPSVGYVGLNDSTREMLERACAELGCPGPLLDDDDAARDADVVVIDLGVDASAGPVAMDYAAAEDLVARVEQAVRLLRQRSPEPKILVVNAISGVWEKWAHRTFNLSYGTFHTRVQPAELRADGPEDASAWDALHTLIFLGRIADPPLVTPGMAPGHVLNTEQREGICGLGTGWESIDEDGVLVSGDETARVHFRTAADTGEPVHAVLELTSWSGTEETHPTDIHATAALDGEVLLDERMRQVERQLSFHAPARLGATYDHALEFDIRPVDGSPYRPRISGGSDPWFRLEALVLARPGDPSNDDTEAGVLAMGRGTSGERLLEGWWAKSDVDGVWVIDGGGVLRIPAAIARDGVGLELLGHPSRSGQAVEIEATGARSVTTRIDDASAEQPRLRLVALPEPDADGCVRLSIRAVDPPTEHGELVKIRGIVNVRPAHGVGDVLVIACGSGDLVCLRDGWHWAEDTGVWMAAEEATVEMRTRGDLPAGTKVYFDLHAFDPKQQAVTMRVDGEEVRLRRSRRHGHYVQLPHGAADDAVVSFTIAVSHMMSPSDAGASGDDRRLGALLRRISIGQPAAETDSP